VEGSGKIFGEVPVLVAALLEGTGQVFCRNGGPVILSARGEEGVVVAEILEGLVVLLGAVVVGLMVALTIGGF